MPRPTIAAIRRALEDLGVGQVDPSSWFDGTMPEILRASIDMGPIAPLPIFNFIRNNVFTTGAVAGQTFDITGAPAATIRVVNNLNIIINTGNIEQIQLQHFDGFQTNLLWQDAPGGFHTIGPYIGTDNPATRSWGAQGLNRIVLYPPELTFIAIPQRQLQIRLLSAAAVIKTVTLSMNVTDFDSRLYNGGAAW